MLPNNDQFYAMAARFWGCLLALSILAFLVFFVRLLAHMAHGYASVTP